MLESIIRKLGMTIEKYSEILHDYKSKISTEDDNPVPGLPDIGLLTREEVLFMGNYVSEHGL